MASSSGTTNPLIAGVGAFAVVVGGLTMYKRYSAKKSTPSSAGHAEVGITAPDLEPVEPTPEAAPATRTISPQNLMSVELSRAFRMIGRSSEELLTEYGDEIFVTGDQSIKWRRFDDLDDSAYIVPFALTISGDYNAELGFFCDRDGKVTRIVVMTGGAQTTSDGDVAATIIKQADLNWQPGVLERSVEHGLALRYTTETMRIVATHRSYDNQWRFDVSPIKDAGEIGGMGTIGTGKYSTANCDVVGRTPAHLGNGKFFTLGQSQQAALAAAQRIEPDSELDDVDDQSVITLPAGIPSLSLNVLISFGKVKSLQYFSTSEDAISEQRHDEFSSCWNKRVALVDDVAYWQANGERYQLTDGKLDITRIEQVPQVVQRLVAGIGKADTNLADLEAAWFIANTPDWLTSTDLFLDDDADKVVAAAIVIGFEGKPARRTQLLQEIERGLGTGKLIRNAAGVPVLQFKTKQVTIDVQANTATDMDIMVSGRDYAAR